VKFFFSAVFRSMAAEFLAIELWERSVVRAAVAYGPVILGRECKAGAQILQETAWPPKCGRATIAFDRAGSGAGVVCGDAGRR
jgi:hypothetical protein